VYGLTKGQFSATADLGSTLKSGVANELPPIDTCELAISLGATFVGRSFSGDKRQLHSMLKAAIAHKGTVLLDVISPCVTFNDHEGSTKSYKYAKDHDEPLQEINFIPAFEDIAVEYDPGTTVEVTMHDGSRLRLRKLEEDYDPTNKIQAITRLNQAKERDEMLTGVLYVNTQSATFLEMLNITEKPLATLPSSAVRPGPEVLERVMEELR
jgi:2-oxoglutarate ferredoxin oxidoreductase subunit beta